MCKNINFMRKDMMDYKIVPNIEPNDPFEKAKLDVIKARESILKLSPVQQRRLAEELFGVAYVEMVINMFNNLMR